MRYDFQVSRATDTSGRLTFPGWRGVGEDQARWIEQIDLNGGIDDHHIMKDLLERRPINAVVPDEPVFGDDMGGEVPIHLLAQAGLGAVMNTR